MQKFVHLKGLDTKLQLISTFVVDHVKGFIYVVLNCITAFARGGKNTHTHEYPWVKTVTGMERVAKRVSTGIINGYLTTHYYMDTDMD